MRRLLGLRDFVHDAIEKTTNLVEETHEAVARKPIDALSWVEPLGQAARAVDGVRKWTARSVFDGIRATNRGVQSWSEVGVSLVAHTLDQVAGLALQQDRTASGMQTVSGWVDDAESALNAVVGDFLAARENALAIKMSLRAFGRELPLTRPELGEALPYATPKVCLFVHGLASSDSIWGGRHDRDGTPRSFGTRLAHELGFTPLYVRYNSGLHVSQNGRALAQLLDAMLDAYPCEITQLVLVGHSMGGLVARSAAHYAKALDCRWLPRLSHVMCIGSPHGGAPLERAGNALSAVLGFFDTAATQVTSKVLNGRSAGIKDLRYGSLLDEDWADSDPDAFATDTTQHAPFVDGVAYGYVAAQLRPAADGPWNELIGDLLVHLPSASGKHRDVRRHLPFQMGHVVEGAHHLALPTHPEVYLQLKRFLTDPEAQSDSAADADR